MLLLILLYVSRVHIASDMTHKAVFVQVNNSALAWPGCFSIGQSLAS